MKSNKKQTLSKSKITGYRSETENYSNIDLSNTKIEDIFFEFDDIENEKKSATTVELSNIKIDQDSVYGFDNIKKKEILTTTDMPLRKFSDVIKETGIDPFAPNQAEETKPINKYILQARPLSIEDSKKLRAGIKNIIETKKIQSNIEESVVIDPSNQKTGGIDISKNTNNQTKLESQKELFANNFAKLLKKPKKTEIKSELQFLRETITR